MSKAGRIARPSVNKSIKSVISNYKMDKTIGEGTFGKVKIGVHLPTDEQVAIKILEKDKIQDKDDLDRVAREINFLKKLKHQNVIKIYEIVENLKNFYIIMEYAAGGELFDYIIQKKKLDEVEASYFFVQIINGLEYIHKNNIVHRDLKPENLLLTENNIVKIIDFGLSNQYKQGQLLSTPCGSPCYAAPEMISGKKYSGIMVDIWSTGIILYAMVCGCLPFEDKNKDKLCKKILNCNLEFPDHVSNICRDLITKLLTVNPSKRIKLDEIKGHTFLKAGDMLFRREEVPQTIDRNKMVESVLQKMITMGFDKKDIFFNVENKKHNNVTTTYELFLNKLKPPSVLQTSSSEKEEKGNINININYMNKIGEINININEKKDNRNLSGIMRNLSESSKKPITKENSENILLTEEQVRNTISGKSRKINIDGNNYAIPALNTSPGRGNFKHLTYIPNKSRVATSLNKGTAYKYHKSTTSSFSQSNREIYSGKNSKEINNSLTLDLPTFIKDHKVDSNNFILSSGILTPTRKFSNNIYPKYSDFGFKTFNSANHTGRTITNTPMNRKINTSISLDKRSDFAYSIRSNSKENTSKYKTNTFSIASKFVPSNTIDLTKSGANKTRGKNHKSSYSLMMVNQYRRSMSSTSEENRGNRNEDDNTLTDFGKTSRLTGSFSKKGSELGEERKKNTRSQNPKSSSSQGKNLSNLQNIISDFRKRIKNLSIADIKHENPPYQNFFTINSNPDKVEHKNSQYGYLNTIIANSPNIPNFDVTQNCLSNPPTDPNNIQKKFPNSTKHKNQMTFQSFKAVEKKQAPILESITPNINLNNSIRKVQEFNKGTRVVDLSNNIAQVQERDSSATKRKKSPSQITYTQQFNRRGTKTEFNTSSTPIAAVTLKTQSSTHSSNTNMTSNSSNSNTTPTMKKSHNELVNQSSNKKQYADKKGISSKNFTSFKINSTPTSSNSVTTPLKYEKYLKSSLKINTGNDMTTVTQHKIQDLVVDLSEKKVTDFACCTLSGQKAIMVNETLKDFCDSYTFHLKEVRPDSYECSRDNNIILLEISNIGSSKMLKLRHLSGIESITKDMIKKIIINIGF